MVLTRDRGASWIPISEIGELNWFDLWKDIYVSLAGRSTNIKNALIYISSGC